jgi:hypothetical protein
MICLSLLPLLASSLSCFFFFSLAKHPSRFFRYNYYYYCYLTSPLSSDLGGFSLSLSPTSSSSHEARLACIHVALSASFFYFLVLRCAFLCFPLFSPPLSCSSSAADVIAIPSPTANLAPQNQVISKRIQARGKGDNCSYRITR